ncbi:hypothetical protein DUNSADRAFT_9870 [Dunaliella salina]|uniref:Uncharacterized protein n=1 Tax=Dunaliella salina TaxID=3046 RepID=A0ABQ7H551_DUNSA|nr:hypothetical protein DUNSADRAFT_9870 [Dunaliella salina]KAF5841989.1 hypothetical protein DUNSADRAFT_9870 [Dunaliella salina]|eukprot:KAF5841988.1 hypothetical protein DUNSADRAFT_9870 [Dunaliella salina]
MVQDEQPSTSFAAPPPEKKSPYAQAPFSLSSTPKHHVFMDIPSTKYKEIEQALGHAVAKQAFAPPSPILPRRSTPKTWNATMKERNPLASSLTGPGRAGKFGELSGETGGQYQGEILAGRPHGHGYYFMKKGPGQFQLQYEGDFVRDKQEGMGALFMMQRQRKYVAEYVNGAPVTGTMLDIDNADLEPLQGQLVSLALHKKLENANNGISVQELPSIDIAQPNKILGEQFIAVRKMRGNSHNREIREMQTASGSLADKEVDMIRHSFSLMAGGDGLGNSLHPHQLRELCVMAGLDPAAPATHALVEAILARKDPETGRISYDSCMQVACHYQVKAELLPNQTSVGEVPPTDGMEMFGVDQAALDQTGASFMSEQYIAGEQQAWALGGDGHGPVGAGEQSMVRQGQGNKQHEGNGLPTEGEQGLMSVPENEGEEGVGQGQQ